MLWFMVIVFQSYLIFYFTIVLPTEGACSESKGSDEDEDEIPLVDFDDFGTGDQDDDDCATLRDLEWELASSTGRLTRCDQDIEDLEQRYVQLVLNTRKYIQLLKTSLNVCLQA